MKRRYIIATAFIGLVIAIIIRPSVLDGLLAFFLLGLIPGTTWSIPPLAMLLAYPIAIIIVIRWLSRQPLYVGSQAKQDTTARQLARKRITKKTTKTSARRRKTARA